MTNFLGAELLQEQLEEIYQASKYLQQLLEMPEEERARLLDVFAQRGYVTTYENEVKKALEAVVRNSEAAWRFLDGLSSAPIIYTGPGSTEEVIEMLERLLRQKRRGSAKKRAVS